MSNRRFGHLTATEREFNCYLESWNSAVAMALVFGSYSISKENAESMIGRPETSGFFFRSVGRLAGQIADWRCSIEGSSLGIHVVEYIDRYEVHVDAHDPHKTPVRHLLLDYYPSQLTRRITDSVLKKSWKGQR